MKLKAIHVYQTVKFNKANRGFISSDVPGLEDVQLELIGDHCVSIKSATDHILVFSTNIAYAVPLTEETKAQKHENRKELAPKKGV